VYRLECEETFPFEVQWTDRRREPAPRLESTDPHGGMPDRGQHLQAISSIKHFRCVSHDDESDTYNADGVLFRVLNKISSNPVSCVACQGKCMESLVHSFVVLKLRHLQQVMKSVYETRQEECVLLTVKKLGSLRMSVSVAAST
jgi:hypothetical protein